MVCNIADEIFGAHYHCKSVDLGGQSVAVLLMTEEQLGEEHILCYNRLQEFSRDNLDLELYGSLGNTVASQKEIYLSYKNAVQYMEMGHLVKRNSLIDSASSVNVNYREKMKSWWLPWKLHGTALRKPRSFLEKHCADLQFISHLFGKDLQIHQKVLLLCFSDQLPAGAL